MKKKKETPQEFAELLEANGFRGAMRLVLDDLIPIARKHGITLRDAAHRYSRVDEDQDTSFYQMVGVLRTIEDKEYREQKRRRKPKAKHGHSKS